MIDFTKAPIIMGVVNVTPDSFSDGGKFMDVEKAISHALLLEKEGAEILDIGGESTRPGAVEVGIEGEQSRVLPVIEGLKKAGVRAQISVDTRHSDTMRKAIDCGADIVNDVSALEYNSKSFNVIKKAQVPVILMHMQGTPSSMQDAPRYKNVVEDVFDYLRARVDFCVQGGIKRQNIICDPGIGFGKTLEDNLKLLKKLDKFQELGCPILLGASRKSFIEKIDLGAIPQKRLSGSLAAALWGLQQGVQIFRVHDVAETKQAFSVFQAIKNCT